MSKVIIDMAISLDGCIATREGEDGGLHDYFFSPSGDTAEIVREGILTTGAIIMGRRAYDLGAKLGGFVDDPYAAAQFAMPGWSTSCPCTWCRSCSATACACSIHARGE